MYTIDIAVDKFGFYVGWGCIAWVPTFYPLASVYMVKHSPEWFGQWWFTATVAIGIGHVILNYWCDYQRQVFRASGGKCSIWWKPSKVIHATYEDEHGEWKRSILFASGFWGLARHFNYVFELGAAYTWCVGCGGWLTSPLPWMYPVFLTVLLVHRSFRDDDKCARKYGKYWQQYCDIVPYRIVPYVC